MEEVAVYIKNAKESQPLNDYLKKFTKLSLEKANKIKESIAALNNPKIKDGHIVKIVDFLPKDQEDVNKILIDTSLNEEESRAILEIIKKD